MLHPFATVDKLQTRWYMTSLNDRTSSPEGIASSVLFSCDCVRSRSSNCPYLTCTESGVGGVHTGRSSFVSVT